jgi:Domain of unknown function (DUF4272)
VSVSKRDPSDAPEEPLVPRSAVEVAERCLALIAVTGHAWGQGVEDLRAWLSLYRARPVLSPEEHAFLSEAVSHEKLRTTYSWRAEALAPLLWALRLLPEMPPLDQQFSPDTSEATQPAIADPTLFVAKAQLRDAAAIAAAEAELFDAHWQVRDAQLFGRPVPSGLNPDIVYERRYALSWLVGWGRGWDEVPTDT